VSRYPILQQDISDFARSDTIDGENVEDRIEELENERENFITLQEDALPDDEEVTEAQRDEWANEWEKQFTEEAVELHELTQFRDEVLGYSGESRLRDVTLIADDYFVAYTQDYADQVGAIPTSRDGVRWPLMHIDWEAAAEDLKSDYSEVELLGHSFWYR
jgi:hypothetical protein